MPLDMRTHSVFHLLVPVVTREWWGRDDCTIPSISEPLSPISHAPLPEVGNPWRPGSRPHPGLFGFQSTSNLLFPFEDYEGNLQNRKMISKKYAARLDENTNLASVYITWVIKTKFKEVSSVWCEYIMGMMCIKYLLEVVVCKDTKRYTTIVGSNL